QQLLKEHVITTTPDVFQYPLPDDYLRFAPNTQWNRTQSDPIIGDVGPQTWQGMKSGYASTSTTGVFRISGGYIELMPTPQTAQTIVLDYYCNSYVVDGTDLTRKQEFTLDADKTVFH